MISSVSPSAAGGTDQLFSSKQTKIISFLEQGRRLISDICNSHFPDKYTLSYPYQFKEPNGSIKYSQLAINGSKHSSAPSSPTSNKLLILTPTSEVLAHDLDEASMAKILYDKLMESCQHLERLKQRICDKTSRILVTGDVNAGKSTFVNALMGYEILPTDQQPCTQSFCEIIPTKMVSSPYTHAIKNFDVYNPNDELSFSEMQLDEMQVEIQNEETDYVWYRLFWPASTTENVKRFDAGNLLDIGLIDSPGLNSDLFKTTSLFSKQQDIDVIVFVINAANHLTLSASEFLEKAGKEKAYIFIVVNKFDDIKNQEKCKRMVLQQIAEILPQTFKESTDLIHFVSAARHLHAISCPGEKFEAEFERLEKCLRDFILEKRIKSKLLPAYTYLGRLLYDLTEILQANCEKFQQNIHRLETELEMISPCYEELVAHDIAFRTDIQEVVNSNCKLAYDLTFERLEEFTLKFDELLAQVNWRGLFYLSQFRKDLANKLLVSSEIILNDCFGDISSNLISSLHLLNATATSHAVQVFNSSSSLVPVNEMLSNPTVMTCQKLEILDLAPWDLIDFHEEFWSNKTWIGATTIGAAFFGYRPLINLSMNVFDVVLSSKKSGKMVFFALIGITGTIAVTSIISDIEGMIRRRFSSHCREYFSRTKWPRENSRRFEVFSRDTLMKASLSLIARFEEAVHYQRRLRAEKDIEVRQGQSILEHFEKHRKAVEALRNQIEAFTL